MMREKRDLRPVLLNFGVALALSFGGILYTILRIKRIRPYKSPPSDCGNGVDLEEENDDHSLQTTLDSVEPEKHEDSCVSKITADNALFDPSPSNSSSQDLDRILLPEFRELVNGFSSSETPKNDVDTPREFKFAEIDICEEEINSLKDMVKFLKERVKNLEIQLLEYYGLKEQETAVTELQNRLKVHNLEVKLLTVKIESLLADNRRMEAQVADHAKVVAELEEARAKIKFLKKKLWSEAERNKEQILSFQERLVKLQEQEDKTHTSDVDTKVQWKKLKDLEEEAEELRKSNYKLRMENSNLAQLLANSTAEDQEVKALKEESYRLRQENENLSEKIEQLQTDRCGDAEEFVYLRWINACLRYELRNYQAGPGKTVARDLNMTISPESEEKAKQLILDYARKEAFGEKGMMNSLDFDSDRWSHSSVSHLTDSAEFDGLSVDNSSADRTNTSSKRNFVCKLSDIKRGKDGYHHSRCSSGETSVSFEDPVNSSSSKNAGGVYRRIGSVREGNNIDDEGIERFQRSELLKYAKVLEDSHGGSTSKFHRRSASSFR